MADRSSSRNADQRDRTADETCRRLTPPIEAARAGEVGERVAAVAADVEDLATLDGTASDPLSRRPEARRHHGCGASRASCQVEAGATTTIIDRRRTIRS